MKLFLTGGFLGSGKTTAIQQASLQLLQKGSRVAVITNDQGEQLIDTRLIRGANIPALEVSSGCFCCKYDQLEHSIRLLQDVYQPEIIFAEAVGSCTDLVATIVKPFLQFHPNLEVVVSVFADAHTLPILIQDSRLFADNVNYIYKKQLEEADVLVITKIDLLTAAQIGEVKQLMHKHYPGKVTLYQNSFDGEDIQHWLETLNSFQLQDKRASLELDYDKYGAGEAELAWLDKEIEIYTSTGNALTLGYTLLNSIYAKVKEQEFPIGHLKFLMDDGILQKRISFTAADQPAAAPDYKDAGIKNLHMFINARVQAEPDALQRLVADAVAALRTQPGCSIVEGEMAAFQPGYPAPTHRIED
ncbi:hypothetical protein I2I11_20670 [Pontibacter sp. 172403-2]|uniref:GTP-binding protein n=1 Tax=Pontibacter rufus TaxID=2791028 RepID=UPI0018AFE789|nr:GTP-binding protein [Pontibacter sp. 172403-2]MBF9255724.1 hypothetical protein [Pontibacter sp. 172403-2]